jgi:hypothetical protein
LAGLAAWTSARVWAAAGAGGLSEAAALARERAAALDLAEANFGAATDRGTGLLEARRAIDLARNRVQAAREEGDVAMRRLEGSAAAGLAALALMAHRNRGVGAGREASTLRRAAASGAVAPWADRLGRTRLLEGENARLAERGRELDARLDEAAPKLRRLAAAVADARQLALEARREVAEAARRDATRRDATRRARSPARRTRRPRAPSRDGDEP